MVVIISNNVLKRIEEYADALTKYSISQERAKEKVVLMKNAIIGLGNTTGVPPICMYKDLLQTFDKQGNPINKNLKRFNYKDKSNFQWAFACLYDYENNTITILKMMPAISVRESLTIDLDIIVETTIRNYMYQQALLENNNIKRQNTMKQRIRLTEGDLHRFVRKCINEALNELDWKTLASASEKARNRGVNYWRGKGRNGFDAIHDTAMSKIRADRFGRAAQDAFDRDYGYQQGELGDDNYQRVGMGGSFNGTEEFGPHAAGWKKAGYCSTSCFPHRVHGLERTPEEFFDGNDDAVDAYNKAKEEMRNFKKGNYDYIKGKGYQLKN